MNQDNIKLEKFIKKYFWYDRNFETYNWKYSYWKKIILPKGCFNKKSIELTKAILCRHIDKIILGQIEKLYNIKKDIVAVEG